MSPTSPISFLFGLPSFRLPMTLISISFVEAELRASSSLLFKNAIDRLEMAFIMVLAADDPMIGRLGKSEKASCLDVTITRTRFSSEEHIRRYTCQGSEVVFLPAPKLLRRFQAACNDPSTG